MSVRTGSRRSVLVVDDNGHVRELLRDLLEEHGYQVCDAVTGAGALEVTDRTPIDLLLADVVLPDEEAIETIRALRGRLPRLRVIVMSGAIEAHDAETIRMLRADEAIRKPFNINRLLHVIDRLLRSDIESWQDSCR